MENGGSQKTLGVYDFKNEEHEVYIRSVFKFSLTFLDEKKLQKQI